MLAGSKKKSAAEPNPAWVAFFAEARRLAELARQRRAAREAEQNEQSSEDERPLKNVTRAKR